MYKVYCDDYLLFADNVDEYTIIDPSLTLELNKVGSFTFTIYDKHPYYGVLHQLKSIIRVYQDNELIFRGRVLNDEQGWLNERKITCEGELAFLNDSIIKTDYESGSQVTITSLFTDFINRHNRLVDEDHQFLVGNILNITLTDGVEDTIEVSNSEYESTWNNISEKLIKEHGGYLWVRHEEDGNYIDYLADFETHSNQTVELGRNLLDVVQTVKGEDVVTGIIPLGAELGATGDTERLTIASVNNEKEYLVNEDKAALYGYIFAPVIWDEIDTPSALLAKAQEYLTSIGMLTKTIEITAVDLAALNTGMNPFKLGTKVKVVDDKHDITSTFLVKKLSIDLMKPESNKLSLDSIDKSFTEQTRASASAITSLGTKVNTVEQSVNNIELTIDQKIAAEIEVNADAILQTVENNYYVKGDTDALIEQTKTEFKQKDDEFEFRFTEFQADIDAVASGADANFSEIRKYIRFIDGNIILGEEGNELVLKIQNDRISFLQNNVEVAYFSNKKLYVTDGEYINSLKIGSYAFMPRANGNLSLKKVN